MTDAQTRSRTDAQCRRIIVSFLCVCACVRPCVLKAQQRAETALESFSMTDILSAPFPGQLVAAPNGRAVAWIGNEEGKRNIWVAEAPQWRARRLTRWMTDDGQELSELTWTAESRALLVVRGGDPGGNQDRNVPANPVSDTRGTDQSVWIVQLRAGVPRRIGDGYRPVPSPRNDRVVWVLRDTLRTAPLYSAAAPQVLLRARGASGSPAFAPDGRSLAFVSRRGDHSFIGVFDFATRTIRWVSPGTFRDEFPRWSPDGTMLAYLRRPGLAYGTGPSLPEIRSPGHTAYAVRVADAASLDSRDLWRSPNNNDAGFPGVAGEWVLQWGADRRLVFASEQTGWVGLYVVSADGGEAARITPAGCEIYDVVLSRDRQSVLYASNCGDIDRRHLQRVPVAGGTPEQLTVGSGLEWNPVPVLDSGVAALIADARRPASPALVSESLTVLAGWPQPANFPGTRLVEPRQVVVRTADSVDVHLQVFAPESVAAGERLPVILYFHGGPQRQMLLGWHYRGYYHHAYAFNQYMASRGFLVVSVNYRGGVGYGRAFREASRRGRFGAAEYTDVMATFNWLRSQPTADTARVGLWGGSYGGYLTALGLARNSDLFAAGFDLHGVHDYAEEVNATRQFGVSDSAIAAFRRASPIGDLARWRSPVLFVHGDDDRNVQFQQTTDLAVRLRRMGVRVEELVFPDEIHGFLRHANWVTAYRAGAGFLAEILRGQR